MSTLFGLEWDLNSIDTNQYNVNIMLHLLSTKKKYFPYVDFAKYYLIMHLYKFRILFVD